SFHLDKPMDLGRWADADQDGHWLCEGLPSGVVQLECFEYGYIPVAMKDVATGRRDLDVVMTRSGGIKGTVVDDANQPISRFRIALTPSVHPGDARAARPPAAWSLPGRLFEAADGRFSSGRTPLDPDQVYRVEVSARGYATRVIDPYIPTLGPRNAPVRVVLAGGGSISGRVVDAQGQGIGDAVVAPVGTFPAGVAKLDHGPRATTDDTGAYTLSGLATGPVELEARHGRFAPVRRLVRVSSQLSQEPDLVMLAAGSLRVEVRVSPEDLGQTRVVLESGDAQARAEHPLTSNVLTLHWVVAGRYRVSLASSRSELDGLGTTVDILAGRRRPIAFEPVPATCDLLGHVTVDGRVLSDTVIDLVLSRVHPDGTRTHHANRGSRPNGSFSFPDLKPGRWHIGASFTHGGQRLSGQLTVGVKPGQPPIQIRLRTQ
ncbi:MAG: carboxypeptidase-like regulatory domain-containing protein, partial [Planctomycetota bacterium]|nr:carboxypeptidase-like regulatory domain-containing protein [Planctomycetota bacterium]